MAKETEYERCKREDKEWNASMRKKRTADKKKQKRLELITQKFLRWLNRRFTRAQVEMFTNCPVANQTFIDYLDSDAKFGKRRLEQGQLLIMVFVIFPITSIGYADALMAKKSEQLEKHGLILTCWNRKHLFHRHETIRNFLMVVPESELEEIMKTSLAISVLYPHPRQNIKLFEALVKRLENGGYKSDEKIFVSH